MVTADVNEELAEIFVDFLNATEAACVNAKHQIAEIKGVAEKNVAAVNEITFSILKFEVQQGAKLGEYEIAYKTNNIADKFTVAYNILRNSNATIKDRYHGSGYEYSYWIYGDGKIYRQKLRKV